MKKEKPRCPKCNGTEFTVGLKPAGVTVACNEGTYHLSYGCGWKRFFTNRSLVWSAIDAWYQAQ